MTGFKNFFLDFLSPLFKGFISVLEAILDWIINSFNIVNYINIINEYKGEMGGASMILVILTIVVLLAIYGAIIFFIVKGIKRLIRYRKNVSNQETLMEQVEMLNRDIIKYQDQKENYEKMLNSESGDVEYDENGNIINKLQTGESRFNRLSKVDEEMKSYKPAKTNDTINLKELCEMFRNYSASELKLYYPEKIIKLFIASLASNKLIILQGISGTGKTSLAYAFGKFLNNDACICPVQPSWRDRSEVFGYFNEFTKRFNETDLLVEMYKATYEDRVFIGVLDEMNISRVEYYFAEMLSLLEMPKEEYRILSVVPSGWDNDPKNMKDGKIKIPANMWYIGTINNDDSTFMITDKVYDRAMPINIDEKADPFEAPKTKELEISYTHLRDLFLRSQADYKVSDEVLAKLQKVDKYIIEHFRIAFGNRIVKQLTEFVPAYVACGATEVEGVDYVLANKILRKFDQLNLGLVRNEIDGFVAYLDELFGEGAMVECIAYLNRLKKMI